MQVGTWGVNVISEAGNILEFIIKEIAPSVRRKKS